MKIPLLIPLILSFAACSTGNSVSDRAQSDGYIAGDGTIQKFSAESRDTVITLRGSALDGASIDSATWRGSIVVINTWGSWCAPCNAEAPDLAAISAKYGKSKVKFLGVNLREDPPAGQAFERKFNIKYPSLAWDGGRTLVQLKGKASSTPSTLVLDPQGRLAARVAGKIDRGTLTGLLDDLLVEAKLPLPSASAVTELSPSPSSSR